MSIYVPQSRTFGPVWSLRWFISVAVLAQIILPLSRGPLRHTVIRAPLYAAMLSTRSLSTCFWRGAALLSLCAGAYTSYEKSVIGTSCAWSKERIDIGSGAGISGSMETYDQSNGADAEEEEEPYNDDFFSLPRDPWEAASRRPQPSRDAAAAAGLETHGSQKLPKHTKIIPVRP